jgi:DNA modification methylase
MKPEIRCDDNLAELKKLPGESVDLAYIDPPYNTGRDFGDFYDKWASMDEFVSFMEPRLKEIHRVLKPSGTLYLHCFTGDTLVAMSDFTLKRVDEIKEDDSVFSDSGKIDDVVKVWKHHYAGEMVSIKCLGQYLPLITTPNHQVYTVRKERNEKSRNGFRKRNIELLWKSIEKCRADTLKVGDLLLIPLHELKDEIKELKTDDFIKTKSQQPSLKILPDVLYVDNDLFRFFGYYLAEGRVVFTSNQLYNKKPSGIDFTININEKELREEIVLIGKTKFGLEATVLEIPERNGCRIMFYSTQLGELFLSLFNTGSHEKKIHQMLLKTNPGILRELVNGWMIGDGYVSYRERNAIEEIGCTVSYDLALQLYHILLLLGELPRFELTRHEGMKQSGYSNGKAYRIAIPKNKKHSPRKYDENYAYIPITKIERTKYDGLVYNLSIKTIHSYQANFFKVSNCDEHADAYLRVAADKIFGPKNFVNEIIWAYSGGGAPKNRFASKHDTILVHAKNAKDRTFNTQYAPFKPGASRHSDGSPYRPEGKIMDDWWADIPPVSTASRERIGYATQKPEKLLERVILASSNPGDIVLDAFAGSGTTCKVASRLGRKAICMDKNPKACKIMEERLQ